MLADITLAVKTLSALLAAGMLCILGHKVCGLDMKLVVGGLRLAGDLMYYNKKQVSQRVALGRERVMSELLATSATLRRGVTVKVLFVLLASIDFLFTLLALRLGLTELNPVIGKLVGAPGYFFLFKVMVSLFLAWLIPSRLLLPSLALLSLVVAWNLKELMFFFS